MSFSGYSFFRLFEVIFRFISLLKGSVELFRLEWGINCHFKETLQNL